MPPVVWTKSERLCDHVCPDFQKDFRPPSSWFDTAMLAQDYFSTSVDSGATSPVFSNAARRCLYDALPSPSRMRATKANRYAREPSRDKVGRATGGLEETNTVNGPTIAHCTAVKALSIRR